VGARASGTPSLWTHASQRQIESFKLKFRENARSRTDHGADIITWPALAGDSPRHHQTPPRSVSLNDSLYSASCLGSLSAPSLQAEARGSTVAL